MLVNYSTCNTIYHQIITLQYLQYCFTIKLPHIIASHGTALKGRETSHSIQRSQNILRRMMINQCGHVNINLVMFYQFGHVNVNLVTFYHFGHVDISGDNENQLGHAMQAVQDWVKERTRKIFNSHKCMLSLSVLSVFELISVTNRFILWCFGCVNHV